MKHIIAGLLFCPSILCAMDSQVVTSKLKDPKNPILTATLKDSTTKKDIACASFICLPNADHTFTAHYFSGSQDDKRLLTMTRGVQVFLATLKHRENSAEQTATITYRILQKESLPGPHIIVYDSSYSTSTAFLKTPDITVNSETPTLVACYDNLSLTFKVETLDHYFPPVSK